MFIPVFFFSGAEVRVRRRPQLRGDPRDDLHLPPRHVRPLRDRDPRQHLLLHARLPDPQVSPKPVWLYRVLHNYCSKVMAYCSYGPNDYLSTLGDHQMWSN